MPRRSPPEQGGRTDTDRRVEHAPPAFGSKLVGNEVRRLQRGVPLRRDVVEAHAVVDRHPVGRTPVVLREPFEVLVAPLRNRELRRLRIGVEHAGRRIGVAEAGIERIAAVVGEINLTVEAREQTLRLEAALEVEASLRGVRAPHFGQIGDHVVGDVLVREWTLIGLIAPGIGRAAAAKDQVGHIVGLHRPGNSSGKVVSPAALRDRFGNCRSKFNELAARPQLTSSDIDELSTPVADTM